MIINSREHLHQLVDNIPDVDLPAARQALARLTNRPTLAELLASSQLDDEELSPEELEAIDQGLIAIAEGRVVSDAKLERRIEARLIGRS